MNKSILVFLCILFACNIINEQGAQTEEVVVPKNFNVQKFYDSKGVIFKKQSGYIEFTVENNKRLNDDDCKYLGLVDNITHFSILGRGNNLSSKCLSCLRNSKSLEYVELQDLQINDEGLKAFIETNRVVVLLLNNINIYGDGLKYFRNNNKLDRIYLSKTQITDENLKYLTVFTNLKRIDLSFTKIKGVGLQHLKTITRLGYIGLKGASITDEGLKYIGELKQYQLVIDLEGTNITDNGLKYLEGCKNLFSIQLYKTKTTFTGRDRLQEKLPDTQIFAVPDRS